MRPGSHVALFLSLLVSSVAAATQVHAETPYELPASAKELMSCINGNQGHSEVTSWQSAMLSKSASLQVVATWWSQKPASIPLTMTTQLSVSRIWQLKSLCMTYDGPVSAVVYRGITVDPSAPDDAAHIIQDDVAKVGRFFQNLEVNGKCKLDLMLVRELFESDEAQMWYPVNQLRNYARLQARTPLVGLIDGDLLVSPLLVAELRDYAAQHKLVQELTQCKVAYILPAFVTLAPTIAAAAQMADRAVVSSKQSLWSLFRRGVVQRFDPTAPGHVATNYSRWFRSEEPYEVQYKPRYEPWVLADRYSVPFYDISFRGYGLNKIIHLESMNSTGYRFVVHPTAFLVHRAHPASSGREAHRVGKRLGRSARTQEPVTKTQRMAAAFAHVKEIGGAARRDMLAGTYEPVVDPAAQLCFSILPWWKNGSLNQRLPAAWCRPRCTE